MAVTVGQPEGLCGSLDGQGPLLLELGVRVVQVSVHLQLRLLIVKDKKDYPIAKKWEEREEIQNISPVTFGSPEYFKLANIHLQN